MSSTKLACLAAAVSLAALVAGLAGWAGALGIASVALLVTLWGLGLRSPGRTLPRTVAATIGIGAALCALLVLAYRLHDPEGALTTIGGLPAGTAMLVYGLPAAGSLVGILYGLAFDREILPIESQREFLERFGRR